MGKHAFLIIAHGDWKLLSKQLMCLDDSRNSFFIHIDKKTQFDSEIVYKPERATCKYIKRRNVTWGGHSQVAVEMDLISEAVKCGPFDYLHLLSGQDLPIKSNNEIHEWFDRQLGSNFIEFDMDSVHQHTALDRISTYWIFQNIVGRRSGIFFKILRKIDKLFRKIQKLLLVDRTRKIPMKIYKGTNWFSITDEMAKEILKYRKEIKRWFYWSLCADEVFLQTIAYNCSLKDKVVNECLRTIDWERGSPYTYKIEDKEMLLASKKFFARKFNSEIDEDIINAICESVTKS